MLFKDLEKLLDFLTLNNILADWNIEESEDTKYYLIINEHLSICIELDKCFGNINSVEIINSLKIR